MSLSRFRPILRLAPAAILAVAIAVPAAAAPCPDSDLQFIRGVLFHSNTASFDTTLSEDERLGYDLRAGTLLLRQPASWGNATSHVRARDAYDVIGVSPGTLVSCFVELTVDAVVQTPACGGSGCWGDVGAWVIAGPESDGEYVQMNLFGPASRPVHIVGRLPIVLVAGEPSVIEFHVLGHQSPGGNHFITADGQIRFDGLPPGVSVVSCQGFGSGPTPATAASWGRLKVAYR